MSLSLTYESYLLGLFSLNYFVDPSLKSTEVSLQGSKVSYLFILFHKVESVFCFRYLSTIVLSVGDLMPTNKENKTKEEPVLYQIKFSYLEMNELET